MNKRHLLIKTLAEFLSREDYDLWVTITFEEWEKSLLSSRGKKPKYVTLEAAEKKFVKFFERLNRPTKYYFKGYIKCWVFYEKRPWGKGVHIHSLIKGINPSFAKMLEKKCQRKFGRSKIEPYISGKGATGYLGRKYESLRLVHWDNYPINSKLRKFSYNFDSDILGNLLKVDVQYKDALLNEVSWLFNEFRPRGRKASKEQLQRRIIGLGFQVEDNERGQQVIKQNSEHFDELLIKYGLKKKIGGKNPLCIGNKHPISQQRWPGCNSKFFNRYYSEKTKCQRLYKETKKKKYRRWYYQI